MGVKSMCSMEKVVLGRALLPGLCARAVRRREREFRVGKIESREVKKWRLDGKGLSLVLAGTPGSAVLAWNLDILIANDWRV